MTNKLAIWLGALIVIFFATDLFFDWGATLFLLRKFIDLITYLAFWR